MMDVSAWVPIVHCCNPWSEHGICHETNEMQLELESQQSRILGRFNTSLTPWMSRPERKLIFSLKGSEKYEFRVMAERKTSG